jgi:hypothetical protein
MIDCLSQRAACSHSVVSSVEVKALNTEPRIVVGKPHTFGWLRRSECDRVIGCSYFEAWERPDGLIVKIPRQEQGKPIEKIIAVRKRGSVLVISPRGTAQGSRSRSSRV